MVLITCTGPKRRSDCKGYSLPRTRQARSTRRNLKDAACLPAMSTMQLCRPLAKQAGAAKTARNDDLPQEVPQTTFEAESGENITCLKLPVKDQPQKISDLLAEMIACNTDSAFSQLALSLETGKVQGPWTRDVVIKPNLPPSDRGKIMSQHSSKQPLSRHSSKEESSNKHSSSQASSFVHAPFSSSSSQMCAVAAAAEAELTAVKARQESSSGQDPNVLLQLGSQAANAASRLRARRHRPPHPPLHLPVPMRMQLKPAAAPTTKAEDFESDLVFEGFSRRASDLSRSRRAAEVSLHVPNPLSAASLRRLGEQQLEEDQDVGSSDEEDASVAMPERRQSAMISDAFADLSFPSSDLPSGVMTPRMVPQLLKKTRRQQEEVAEALHHLENDLDGVTKSARRQWQPQGGSHRLALPGQVPRHQHRLSVMLGLQQECAPPSAPGRTSTLRVNSFNVRSSTDVPEMLRKTELMIDEEGEEKNQSILASVTLNSDRDERLERLRKLTTLHRSSSKRHLDGVTKVERERFQEVFQRYDYNRSGGLDVVEMHDALADLGLKPGSRKEKMELARQAANEDCHEFDFNQFCRIVLQRRKRALEAHRSQLKRLFAQYDADESGTLSADELLQVFNSLALNAHEEDERIAFLDAVIECDINGSGEIEWEEFEPLVQRVREKLGQCHREREVRMREQMKLPPDIFLNFRPQLIPFHDAFRRLEQAGQGSVHVRHISTLAVNLGIARDQNDFLEAWERDEELRALLDHRDFIDFAIFLQVAQRLRVLREDRSGQSLRTIFDMYDVDNSGDISVEELYRLMRDLGFEVKTSLKSEVRQLFEESDVDGSGQIEYKEFPKLFHGVCEMLARRQHNEEQVAAEDLGFSEAELGDLREIFEMLDKDGAGSLKFEEVKIALSLMGERNTSEDTLRKYDQFRLGRLDFISFLKAIKDVRPTLATAAECKRHAFTIPSLPKRGSHDSQNEDRATADHL